jgi:NAD(P)-dependent dehydrogenase (short-subunit alcohol dehydrogenase family)
MSDLKGKVAVVTGASKGIGAATAKSLSTAGAAVVVNYTLSEEDADRLVASIKAKGGKARSRATSRRPKTFGGCLLKRKRPSTGSRCR